MAHRLTGEKPDHLMIIYECKVFGALFIKALEVPTQDPLKGHKGKGLMAIVILIFDL